MQQNKIKDFILNADGRCDKPILENDLVKRGKYEFALDKLMETEEEVSTMKEEIAHNCATASERGHLPLAADRAAPP